MGAGGVPSGAQEEGLRQLAEIRRRATRVAVALVREPFAASTHEQMREFVAEDAEEARALAEDLVALPQEVLRAWMDALCRQGRHPVLEPYGSGGGIAWQAHGQGDIG